MVTKQELVFQQSEEALGVEELELMGEQAFSTTDPIATYRVNVGDKKVGLEYFIGRKEGELKSSFTLKEARALAMSPNWHPFTRTTDNRIPREVVLDELADHFKIEEQELIDRIEELARVKPIGVRRDEGIKKVPVPVTVLREESVLLPLFIIAILFASHKILKNVLKY